MDDPIRHKINGIHTFVDDSSEEYEEYRYVMEYIEDHQYEFANDFSGKRKRNSVKDKISLWETSWGKMLRDPLLLDPKSKLVKCIY